MTGEKALFVNKGFTKRIIGLQHEESDALLQLLFNVSIGFKIHLPSHAVDVTNDSIKIHSTSPLAKTSRFASSGRRERLRCGIIA